MELNQGEKVCNRCRGRGEIIEPFSESHNSYECDFIVCPKCKGYKKLDWIEEIVGVSKPELIPF